MKITDSIIMSQSPLSGGEQYTSKESLKALSLMHHSDVVGTVSRKSEISDIVSLTVLAKINSKQIQSPSNIISADQAVTDYESKGNEAIVQLIEMLTGIKVKLLKQADLLEEAEKRRAITLKMNEMQQGQGSPAVVAKVSRGTENSAVQTKGMLRFADGKEVFFSLDIDLPKDVINSVGLNRKHGSLSRNGIEIYLQENSKKLPVQDHAESASDRRQKTKVIGRLNIDSKVEVAGNNYFISV